jgi:hypothetical protein
MGFFIWIGDLNPNWFLRIPWMGFVFNEERRVAAGGATKSPLGHHQKISENPSQLWGVFLLPNPYFSLYWRLCKQSMSKSVLAAPVANDRANTSPPGSRQIESSMDIEMMK